jgi:hypothetical protein
MDTYFISGGHGRRVVIFIANFYPIPMLRKTGAILPLHYTPSCYGRGNNITLKLTHTLPSNIKILLILSIYASCVGHTDHPPAFKYMIVKTKKMHI